MKKRTRGPDKWPVRAERETGRDREKERKREACGIMPSSLSRTIEDHREKVGTLPKLILPPSLFPPPFHNPNSITVSLSLESNSDGGSLKEGGRMRERSRERKKMRGEKEKKGKKGKYITKHTTSSQDATYTKKPVIRTPTKGGKGGGGMVVKKPKYHPSTPLPPPIPMPLTLTYKLANWYLPHKGGSPKCGVTYGVRLPREDRKRRRVLSPDPTIRDLWLNEE